MKNPSMAERIDALALLVRGLVHTAECSALSFPEDDPEARQWNSLAGRLEGSAISLEAAAAWWKWEGAGLG